MTHPKILPYLEIKHFLQHVFAVGQRESTICDTRLCSSNTRPKPNIALWDPPGAWLFSFQIKFHCLDGAGPLALTILFFSSPSQCMNVTGPHKEQNSTPSKCRKRLLSLIFNPEQPYCFLKYEHRIHFDNRLINWYNHWTGGTWHLSPVYFGQRAAFLGWWVLDDLILFNLAKNKAKHWWQNIQMGKCSLRCDLGHTCAQLSLFCIFSFQT